jgi:hypothetical protein
MSKNNPLGQIENQIIHYNRLSLSEDIIGQNCYKELRRLFGQGSFSIDESKILETTNDRLKVSGTIEELLSWSKIEVEFCLFDYSDVRYSIFKFFLPEDVTANDYIVAHRVALNSKESETELRAMTLDFYLEAIDFVGQQRSIVFSSLDLETGNSLGINFQDLGLPLERLKVGLNFPVNLKIDSEVGEFLAELLGGDYANQTECSSLIYLDDSIPYFKFEKSIQAEKPIGQLTLSLDTISMAFSLLEDAELYPQIVYNASVGKNGSSDKFLASAAFDLYYQILTITFSKFPTLSEWITFAGLDYLRDYFPDTLAKLLDIGLSYLEIVFNIPDASVPELNLRLATAETVQLIEGILDFSPSLSLSFYDPFSSERSVEGELQGIWKLGETQFNTALLYPSMDFYAGMAEGQTLNENAVNAMKEKFFSGVELPPVQFTRLELQANFLEKSYAVNLEITSDWEIKLTNSPDGKMVLSRLLMSMSHIPEQTDYDILALLKIANVDIQLAATYQAGWQFRGSTGYGQEIRIGNLIEDIAKKFGVNGEIPTSIAELIIQNLGVSFNTNTKEFLFTCNAKFPVDGKEVDITLTIDIVRQSDGSYNKTFGGYITLGNLRFNLIFNQDSQAQSFIATYNNPYGDSLRVQALIGYVSDSVAAYIPATLALTLKDALFIYNKAGVTPPNSSEQPAAESPSDESRPSQQPQSTFIFGLNLNSQITLTDLPLVGKQFPPDRTIGINDLQLLVASQELSIAAAERLNTLLPNGISQLPIPASEAGTTKTTAIRKGFNATAQLQLGDAIEVLALPIGNSPPVDSPSANSQVQPAPQLPDPAALTPSPTVSDNTQWFVIQKTFGPLYFGRIGLEYQNAILWFRLDMALSAQGLTISLDGLSFGSPLSDFKPKFDLRGIGIEYKSGSDIEISGAFLRSVLPTGKTDAAGNPITRDEYSGAVVLKTKTFTLSAIGSYTELNGHPSLFIYAFLDKSLGGPAFFFVTGLAAGFGYNRKRAYLAVGGLA